MSVLGICHLDTKTLQATSGHSWPLEPEHQRAKGKSGSHVAELAQPVSQPTFYMAERNMTPSKSFWLGFPPPVSNPFCVHGLCSSQYRDPPSALRKAAAVSIRESQDLLSHFSMGFWGDQRQCFTVPHSSSCPRTAFRAGSRCLIKPLWGFNLDRNVASMPGAGRQCRQDITVTSQEQLSTTQGAKEHDSGTISGSELA